MNRVVVPARQATPPGGIGSLDSILGLLKSLKIRALAGQYDNPSYLVPSPHRLFKNSSTGLASFYAASMPL
jgi:hypothetical protein